MVVLVDSDLGDGYGVRVACRLAFENESAGSIGGQVIAVPWVDENDDRSGLAVALANDTERSVGTVETNHLGVCHRFQSCSRINWLLPLCSPGIFGGFAQREANTEEEQGRGHEGRGRHSIGWRRDAG